MYALSDKLPGKLSIPSVINGENGIVGTPIFTPLSSITSTGDIQEAGFDSVTGDLFTYNISYDDQGYSVYSVKSYRVSPVIKINNGQTTGSITITGLDDDLYELTE